MADSKPDQITEKDRRVINGLAEYPEYTAREMCAHLEMTMQAYLGTTRKPAFKKEMDKLTNDLLEVTRFQRTHALINASSESTQAAKLVAEMAGEVGRNSAPLESGKDTAVVKSVSQIYKDLNTGAIVSIPDLNADLRVKNPPKDINTTLPNCAESVMIVEAGGRKVADCADLHINPPVSTPEGKARAQAVADDMAKALTHLTKRKGSHEII